MHAFEVIADPVRRRILELLVDGEQPSGALTEVIRTEFGISQPAVSQHLRVLKDAGLVVDEQVGTRRLYRIEPASLDALRSYVDEMWDQALAGFKRAAERPKGAGR